MPRKSPGGPRAGFLTARIPEKTKFGLALMSRLYKEPIPDIVIQAINNLFTSQHFGLDVYLPHAELPTSLLSLVWAERESDRVANMAFRYPSVMSGPELRAWELVKAEGKYWEEPAPVKAARRAKKTADVARVEANLRRDVLAEDWPSLLAKALGNA